MTEPRVLVIFDFDKTLVARDSFRLFGDAGASGPAERAILLGYAAAARVGLISNRRYKETVLDRVWRPRGSDDRAALCKRVQETLLAHMVQPAVEALQAHVARGDRVTVLTASPELYVGGFLARISPDVEVHGSRVDEVADRVRVDNLYAERKAAVATELIASAETDSVHVYTDHVHDLALMKLADSVTLVGPSRTTLRAVERAGITYSVLPR